jgi:superfamily II DNA or RNA helicase
MNTITLRNYQEVCLQKITDMQQKTNDVVLAASPSSGKTLCAIEFIKRNPGDFLIITHGQNILKDMWQKQLELHLSDFDQKRVIYGLPQSLKNKDIPKVDLLLLQWLKQF